MRTCSLMWWVAPAGSQPDIKASVPSCKGLAACNPASHPCQTCVQHTYTAAQQQNIFERNAQNAMLWWVVSVWRAGLVVNIQHTHYPATL